MQIFWKVLRFKDLRIIIWLLPFFPLSALPLQPHSVPSPLALFIPALILTFLGINAIVLHPNSAVSPSILSALASLHETASFSLFVSTPCPCVSLSTLPLTLLYLPLYPIYPRLPPFVWDNISIFIFTYLSSTYRKNFMTGGASGVETYVKANSFMTNIRSLICLRQVVPAKFCVRPGLFYYFEVLLLWTSQIGLT